ncbi:MAG: prephenate dehydrogenase/arogenate dehydrogenase family protein, partial [Candidatus Omnitrophota bacterium]|nr:prephenate dehydrogenase/arogenate dehydrogenase family protein [Candidatus Omnitrophota bacterium]
SLEVVGVSRHAASLALAKKLGAIDLGSRDILILKGADLVILAAPVEVILKLAPRIKRIITEECVVTDVGSTKAEIVSKLSKIFANYIGSHPLAGSEKRGVGNARADLFKDSLCILTPVKITSAHALKKVRLLWQQLGAKTVLMDPEAHDKALAFTSHLPHISAFSLMNSVPQGFFRFAASGLKDTTRLASSEAQLWADIFLTNKKNILDALGLFEKNLALIKSAVRKNDRKKLISILKAAQKKRDKLIL